VDDATIERMLRTKYGKELAELKEKRISNLTITHSDILDNDLYDKVISKLGLAQIAITDILTKRGIDVVPVRFKCNPNIKIADLVSKFVGQNRCFEGVVRRVSEVKPRLDVATFECVNCTTKIQQKQNLELTYPDVCENCGKRKWRVVAATSTYFDSQTLLVQESFDSISGTDQPKSIEVLLDRDLCGSVVPGMRVIVSGVLTTKINPKTPLVFDSFISCNYIEHTDHMDTSLTEEEERTIIEISKGDVLSKVIASIAPAIYGNVEEKRGVALQLFGGVSKIIAGSRIRGDIHVLLIGDPSVAKSVLLKYVAMIPPRSIFTHGNSATKAGLTATAIKDGDAWVLEAGALVLADQGLAAVDELDKMSDEDRGALHGAMEQQEIDIAKAGIVAKLLCRCSLLAAANPKLGRFDMFGSIPDQFDLPPALVSRFDLIFVMTDTPSANDNDIAEYILSTHAGVRRESVIPLDLLRKYIIYAKKIDPQMTPEAKEVLKKYYLGVRKQSNGTVPITARSLEALVRLSEASARMRLSKTIEVEDAALTVSVVDSCMRQIAYDTKTNKFDIDRVIGKYPRELQDNFPRIKNAIITNGGVATTEMINKYMMDTHGISPEYVLKYLELMSQEKMLYNPKNNSWRIL
jgi:replicative DNA helicase Mcm